MESKKTGEVLCANLRSDGPTSSGRKDGGLGDTANLELTMECVKNSLKFTQGGKLTEVSIFMHVHADEIRYLDRS
jgi:hypothetical protein